MDFEKAKQYAISRIDRELDTSLHYHGPHHTRDVVDACARLATLEGVKGEDLDLLLTAAWFHDLGFIEQYQKNEPIAARMAEEVLPEMGFSDAQIKVVQGCILATQIPQIPSTHLERIICDADLDYLGRDDHFYVAHTLRLEWIKNGIFGESLVDWYQLQIKFLSAHTYHTDAAQNTRKPYKLKCLAQIKELLGIEE